MAKFSHLLSETAGHVPASLLRGQLAVNIADNVVYASDPAGIIRQVSNGNAGSANAAGALGPHVPISLHPVAQFGVGFSEAQLASRFTDDGTTATLLPVPIFMFGRLWYTPGNLTCPSSSIGYQLVGNVNNRTITMQGATASNVSGSLDYGSGAFTLAFKSDGHLYPWFYLQDSVGIAGSLQVALYRISPYKTWGAVPVSQGFPGAPATSYWG